jgi:hypothetical protein
MAAHGSRAAGVAARPEVGDLWPRILLSPALGALVSNVSGVIDNSRHTRAGLALTYLYFAVTAFTIWQGNRWLYFRLPRRADWFRRPWHRAGILLVRITVYTVPASVLLLLVWRAVTGDPGSRQFAIATAVVVTVIAVAAITHVYETVFLLRDWENDRLRAALTEQARLEAELRALGREVDPHFLFNSLNVLSHLVEQRSAAAVPFIHALSAAYRYVLDARGQRLVPLAMEIEALGRHQTLAAIRYGNTIDLRVRVDPGDAGRFSLPPVTLAELFQNALKHNEASVGAPLRIDVAVAESTLIFANDLRRSSGPRHSTGTGLVNLAQRVKLTAGGDVSWGEEGDRFVVRPPLTETGRRS